jgi:hypothetical protein
MQRNIFLILVSLPCIALAVLGAVWSAGALAGHGLWPADTVTLPEAIATRNNAEALRLIGQGADSNVRGRVRDGLLVNGRDVTVLPVEAAVGAQRADSLRMLLANGARVDEQELRVLRCYERAHPDSGIRDILDARAHGDVECTDVHLPVEQGQ